ncbi:plastid-lipid-associated protein 6, chloroplastic [Nicotiana tabacum]|uniref:Plastid-lipid-associated protein 6, chloroplastic n=1 Tax=Nicotiana tabacum TaxID=4097 RepID=A0A1S4ANG0_TOBAC|nr:plastid-lipid-associated protein 6, chloroplastic [Nicotiana tomentosiformis]XP_016478262.1 PREDICTED: probable plastid-lipid-associated protein 6, chloroplastic [Nicotiana tabacum]
MASLLQHSTLPLSHNHSSSSLPSLTCHFSKISNRNTQRLLEKKKYHIKKSVICQSGIDEVTFIEPPGSKEAKAELIGSLKLKLLSAVSGLNRGLAASEEDLKKADAAAKELESCAGAVDLSADLDKLQGRWKLIYSSAFSGRTLGGSRPGPPTGRLLPITLGQVFQRIDVLSKDFDNIVELELGAPWPLPPAELTATLAHKFELIGSSTIKITFEKTTVKTTGNFSQLPPFEVPRIPDQFRPPSNTGSGEFEVTYIDSDTRVTRGDRGELRVFVIS